MLVVGIDAAKRKTGWAVAERPPGGRERIVATGVIPAEPAQVAALAAKWAPLADLVAIEDNYLDPTHGNVLTLKELARAGARFEQAFAERGATCEYVPPQVWQSAMLAGLTTGRSAKREERKAASVKLVRTLFRIEVSEDAADAVCLAIWKLRRKGFGN